MGALLLRLDSHFCAPRPPLHDYISFLFLLIYDKQRYEIELDLSIFKYILAMRERRDAFGKSGLLLFEKSGF